MSSRARLGLLHTPHDVQNDATTAKTNINLRQFLAWAVCLLCRGSALWVLQIHVPSPRPAWLLSSAIT